MNTLLARDLFLEALRQPVAERAVWLSHLSQESRDVIQPLLEADSVASQGTTSAEERYLRASSLVEETDRSRKTPQTVAVTASQASAATEMPECIGKYRVVSRLGTGAQGAVYRAIHPTLNRDVAIKLSHIVTEDGAQAALQAEAEVLCQLSHPGLAQVYDFDFDCGRPYLVMEFVSGQSLEQLVASGRLTLDQSVDIVIRLCEAMEHAHRHGVVHQDLKPENIVVDDGLRPKIIDFGLANHRNAWSTTDSQFVGGTLAYMSPEQAAAFPLPDENQLVTPEAIDQRADIFALGAILYRLLTGTRLYEASTRDEGVRSARTCEWDRQRLERTNVDRLVLRACAAALACDRNDRPASCAQMAAALCRPAWQRYFNRATTLAAVGGLSVLAITLLLIVRLFSDGAGGDDSFVHDTETPVHSADESKSQPAPDDASSAERRPQGLLVTHLQQSGDPEKPEDMTMSSDPLSPDRPPVEYDSVILSAQFDQPGHCMLIEVQPSGETALYWPSDDNAETLSEFRFPPKPPESGERELSIWLDYGTGQYSYFLLFSDQPLPEYEEVVETLRNDAGAIEVSQERGFWSFHNGRAVSLKPLIRSVRPIPGGHKLTAACRRLESTFPDLSVRAATFPVAERSTEN